MIMRSIVVVLLCLTIETFGHGTQENPRVSLSLGQVRGSMNTTRLGRPIFMFRGLRYGETTAEQNRFKLAIPAKPWTGVFDASEEGPSCPTLTGRDMDEDCLRLNVYTTTMDEKSKRPVIVYFHTGAFMRYSGQSYIFGPQYLLDEDVVLVTVNYRLGAFGFIATGDELAPGNLGLKDQVESLRWVKNHVSKFGGDPNCVTLFGYSAGSWSVALHLLSPMSSGLFHRAISMSGSPTTGPLLAYEKQNLAKKQAELVGCPTHSTKAILNCLKTVPFENILKTTKDFSEWYNKPYRVWVPVVEPELPGVERFLPGQPAELIRQGRFHKVPYIVGSTRDEFASFAVDPLVQERQTGNRSMFNDLNSNWEEIAPICLNYERKTERSREISRALREFYFKGENISSENWRTFANVYSDVLVTFPANRLVNLISAQSNASVYYYHFVYQGRYTFQTFPDTKEPIGVIHQDDLMYLFYSSLFFPYFEKNSPEIPTLQRMTAMWANFAKTGQPIPENSSLFDGVVWEPFSSSSQNYLEIDSNLEMKDHLFKERIDALYRIFPIDSK